MARRKKHTAEQILNLLRQVEAGVANVKMFPLFPTLDGDEILTKVVALH